MKKSLPLLVLLLSVLLTSCSSYKELEMGDVSAVKVNKLSNGGVELQADINIKNPNKYKIKIKKIEADVMVNKAKVGNVRLVKKVVLPSNSSGPQTFVVNTQVSNLIAAVPSLMFGGDINLQMSGFIKGKVFIFSKKYPLQLEKKVSAKDFNIF